jgi:hypothetical protein
MKRQKCIVSALLEKRISLKNEVKEREKRLVR